MRKINTVIVVLTILINWFPAESMAQPFCQWSEGHGSVNEDFGIGVATDKSGNVYTIGYFNSPTIIFGTTTLTNADNSGSSSDVFIVKSDSCGNIVWAKKAGDQDYDDRGKAITTDKNGNVYVTGSYYSYYIKFGSDSLANTGTGWSTYIAKYSPSGNVLWAKGMNASGGVNSTGITIDKNGDLLMSGYYMSDSVKLDAIKLIGNSSENRILIAKYNSNTGNVMWAKNAEYSSNKLSGITTDTTGNVFVSGSFYDSIKIENTVLLGQNNLNAFFAKYNSSGNIVWAKSAGLNYDDEATGIAADKAGNIFISGYFQSDSILFNSVKLKLPSSSTIGNGFLVKCDAAGNALWGKRTNGLSEDYSEVVVTNSSGDVFVAGNFRSSSISLDGVILNNAGANTTYDFYLAKYNTNGQLRWARKAGNTGNDFVETIALGLNGIPYVIGEYASATIAFAAQTLTNNGTSDIYITNDINRIGTPVPQLCEVTVDSISKNNMIYWDKTPYTNVSSFIVYREIATNIYKPIKSIHVDSLSLMVDTVRTKYFPNTGDPNVGTYRYKLQILDTVGNFGLLSPFHNTVYIVDNGSGQFTWNPAYTIEGSLN
ncbi:MAG: SBBP repeat-containing protein, partial [Bacteroidetes bacterium]|nr:SBBP repeat-containing protein [Bacteroidota bacterium]